MSIEGCKHVGRSLVAAALVVTAASAAGAEAEQARMLRVARERPRRLTVGETRYVLQGTAPASRAGAQWDSPALRRQSRSQPERFVARQRSLRELAMKLRPHVIVGDLDYMVEAPDYEAARLWKSGTKAPGTAASSAVSRPPSLASGPEPADANDGGVAAQRVFGTDGRMPLGDGRTDYPHRAAFATNNGCSGALIGPNVGVTNAHCVDDGLTEIRPAWNESLSPQSPFGVWNRNTGEFRIHLPDGWINGRDTSFDWAIIEFLTPQRFPGHIVGWLGTLDSIESTWMGVGWSTKSGLTPNQPLNREGKFLQNYDDNQRYFESLDDGPGDSGMGIYRWLFTTYWDPRLVAINQTTVVDCFWWFGWHCNYNNAAIRWSGVLHNFVHARVPSWPAQ